MAKKNLDIESVKKCQEMAQESANIAEDLIIAANGCKLDLSSDDALVFARSILVYSQTLSKSASSLLSHYSLQLLKSR